MLEEDWEFKLIFNVLKLLSPITYEAIHIANSWTVFKEEPGQAGSIILADTKRMTDILCKIREKLGRQVVYRDISLCRNFV